MKRIRKASNALALVIAIVFSSVSALASSHREAPFVTEHPKADGTDFYMFRSYETGREDYTVFLANYNPLQDAFGGPNYFPLDPTALYNISIDNDADGIEDISFRFRPSQELNNNLQGITLDIGGVVNPIALINAGPSTFSAPNLAITRSYTVDVIANEAFRYVNTNLGNGGHRLPPRSRVQSVTNATDNSSSFAMPEDNIGQKSFPDYPAYAGNFIHTVNIPGCATTGRVFWGQRKDVFDLPLGRIFDLVNLNPLGTTNGNASTLANKNVTTIALEVPTVCLTEGTPGENGFLPAGDDTGIIAAWTASFLPQRRRLNQNPTFDNPARTNNRYVQVSRLANPLFNELIVGLPDKDRYNASRPRDDAQFRRYVNNPTFPALLEALFGVTAPTQFPRNDLLDIYYEGVPGINENKSEVEMMRLNTALAPVNAATQNSLGALSGSTADTSIGYPNGRRPGDDVVDITLRAAMGALLDPSVAPSGSLAFTDGSDVNATSVANFAISNASSLVAGTFAGINDKAGNPSTLNLGVGEVFPFLPSPVPGSTAL